MKNLLKVIAAIVLLNLLVRCTSNRETPRTSNPETTCTSNPDTLCISRQDTQLQVNHELYLCDSIVEIYKENTATEISSNNGQENLSKEYVQQTTTIFSYNERGQLVQSKASIQHHGKVKPLYQTDIIYDAYGHKVEYNRQSLHFDVIPEKNRYQNDSIVESNFGDFHRTWEYDDQMRLTQFVEEFLHDKKVTRYDTLRREISWTLYKEQKPYLSITSCYSASGNLARKVYYGRKDNQWLAIQEESYIYDSVGNEITIINSCRRGTKVLSDLVCYYDYSNEEWEVKISDSTDNHTPWERCCFSPSFHKKEKETNVNGQDSIVTNYCINHGVKTPQNMQRSFYDKKNRIIRQSTYSYDGNEWKEDRTEIWKYDEAGNNTYNRFSSRWGLGNGTIHITETRKHWIPNPAMKEKKR